MKSYKFKRELSEKNGIFPEFMKHGSREACQESTAIIFPIVPDKMRIPEEMGVHKHKIKAKL